MDDFDRLAQLLRLCQKMNLVPDIRIQDILWDADSMVDQIGEQIESRIADAQITLGFADELQAVKASW